MAFLISQILKGNLIVLGQIASKLPYLLTSLPPPKFSSNPWQNHENYDFNNNGDNSQFSIAS
ncbi:hypothetical protein DDT91_06425 [Algoriphagus sp. AK58]|nr:hypothetical protein [Algoriphagus sp. AK58]